MKDVGLLLDLGNSQTRCGVVVDNHTKYFTFSNNFAVVPKGAKISQQYINNESCAFVHDGTIYAYGDIVSKEYMSEALRPSALQNKVEQLSTRLSLNLVFIKVLEYLSHLNSCDITDLDVKFRIKALLPPSEEEHSGDAFCKLVKTIKEVNQVIPKKLKKDINITSVEVFPEGMAAFLGVRFVEEDGVMVSKNEKFAKGYVLIVDIGGGTTDCVIVKDNAMIIDSKFTIRSGARSIFNAARQEIATKYFKLNDNDEAAKIIEDCILEYGSQNIPIEDIVSRSKDKFARKLVKEIESYLESISVPVKQLKGILFVGGGSLPSVRDGKVVSKPVTDIIMSYLQELTAMDGVESTIELLDTNGVSPRMLNLKGLEVIYKMKKGK